jgi:hypothetical protein
MLTRVEAPHFPAGDAEWKTIPASQTDLRPRTRDKYEGAVRVHIVLHMGRRRIESIDVEDIAALIAKMRNAGRAAWTIRGTLVACSRMFAYAARRGHIAANPVAGLEGASAHASSGEIRECYRARRLPPCSNTRSTPTGPCSRPRHTRACARAPRAPLDGH